MTEEQRSRSRVLMKPQRGRSRSVEKATAGKKVFGAEAAPRFPDSQKGTSLARPTCDCVPLANQRRWSYDEKVV